ncbi:MAG TPA: hypothetical protein VFD03_06445 [Clostridia bacterium]|nr:hypothetical protein [Clostridia bacterium]
MKKESKVKIVSVLSIILIAKILTEYFIAMSHQIFIMRDPEYNNTMYLYHAISNYTGWIYVLGIQICGMLIFYYSKSKIRGIIFANFSCLTISTIAATANYFLDLESFVMRAHLAETLCYLLSVNIVCLLFFLYQSFLRRRVKRPETLTD